MKRHLGKDRRIVSHRRLLWEVQSIGRIYEHRKNLNKTVAFELYKKPQLGPDGVADKDAKPNWVGHRDCDLETLNKGIQRAAAGYAAALDGDINWAGDEDWLKLMLDILYRELARRSDVAQRANALKP